MVVGVGQRCDWQPSLRAKGVSPVNGRSAQPSEKQQQWRLTLPRYRPPKAKAADPARKSYRAEQSAQPALDRAAREELADNIMTRVNKDPEKNLPIFYQRLHRIGAIAYPAEHAFIHVEQWRAHPAYIKKTAPPITPILRRPCKVKALPWANHAAAHSR